jgi:PAS domain S-box-containing protein
VEFSLAQQYPLSHLRGDAPAASNPGVLVDRAQLAFIAVERTRMPMVVSDPRLPDNPIVLANSAFLTMTGYSAEEVIGRNCRFLQGPDTDPASVDQIRAAIADNRELTIELLNYRRDGKPFWNQLFIDPIFDDAGRLAYHFASQIDVTEKRRVQQMEATEHGLLMEVDHRAKNALALVQGIVRLTRSDDPRAFARAVQGRVDALAKAHSLLSDWRWQPVPLERLIRATLTDVEEDRVALSGSAAVVSPTHVQPLALVLHELITNACQHGSLSGERGELEISWRNTAAGYEIELNETGGPAPSSERRTGFGSTIVNAIIKRQLTGEVSLDWVPGGLRTRLTLPQGMAPAIAAQSTAHSTAAQPGAAQPGAAQPGAAQSSTVQSARPSAVL